jgi:prepilin-type N-terminal cleavage/methylation domain-containing protein
MTRAGYTLIESMTVVLILSIVAFIAIPRFNWGAVWGAQTDAAVRQLATDLRRTRMHAITHAADNPTGFSLVMTGASPYSGYQIVDLHDSSVVATCTFSADVRCTGGQHFEFGPLGNLKDGGDTQSQISSQGRAYQLQITPATGMVKWSRR